MERTSNADNREKEMLCCPECGNVLEIRLVEVRDEDDEDGELLLLLDCPKGDFHNALTYQDLAAALAAEVMGRLNASRRSPAP